MKFYIIFMYLFFSMMDINIFTNGGGGIFFTYYYMISIFFLHITIWFHQCYNENTYQQFYCCLRYIFYTQLILLCFDVFSPYPENDTFGRRKCIFSHSFWPRWLKHRSSCREFNCLYIKKCFYFPSVSSKKIKQKKKIFYESIKFRKKYC